MSATAVATLPGVPKDTALIVVDMISSYDHPDGEKLADSGESDELDLSGSSA